MVDLTEIVGDTPLRASLVKKLEKVQERLDKMNEKTKPLLAEIEMYKTMIEMMDARHKVAEPDETQA